MNWPLFALLVLFVLYAVDLGRWIIPTLLVFCLLEPYIYGG